MKKELLKLSNIRKDLDLVAYCTISNMSDWKLFPVIGAIILAVTLRYYLKNLWISVAISLVAIPYLIAYIKDIKKYRAQKKELTDSLDIGDISITVLKLSHIAAETIYEPHTHRNSRRSRHSHRHSTKVVKIYHFVSGSSWRVPDVSTHYEWSNQYSLSSQGLENISVSGNEFYYVTLQGYSDISYIYPCKFFELDSELKVQE